LVNEGGRWLIDDIDLETSEKAERDLARFLEKHPEARMITGNSANAVESVRKLRELGKALAVYANDNEAKYPDALQELYEQDYVDRKDLEWFLENVEYVGKGKTAADPPNMVIAYDKTLLEKGKGTNVLFNDTYVGFENPEQLKKRGITGPEKKKAAIGRGRSAAYVHKQLEQIVDLSGFRPEMAFSEALEELKNSVEPALVIVVLWRDLEEKAEVDRTTPINLDPIPAIRLGTALELLLRSVSAGGAKLGYVVDDGVVIIATAESLPDELETRVYDIYGFIRSGATPGQGGGYGGYGGGYGGYGGDGGYGGGYGGYGGYGRGGYGGYGGDGGYGGGYGGYGGYGRGGYGGYGGYGRGGYGGTGGYRRGGYGGSDYSKADEIRQRIIETIEPNSWSGVGGYGAIQIQGDRELIVRQDRQTHQKIEALLKGMAKPAIAIESRFLIVPADANEIKDFFEEENIEFGPDANDSYSAGRILDSEQASRLLKLIAGHRGSRTLTAPKVTVLDGEWAELRVQKDVNYISGYTEPNFPLDRPKSKQDSIETGTWIKVLPRLTKGTKNILLDVDFEVSDLIGFEERTYKGKYPYQIPETEVVSISTRVLVPDGETVLIGGRKIRAKNEDGQRVEKNLLVLIKAKKLDQEDTQVK
jgi:hypothetical protein